MPCMCPFKTGTKIAFWFASSCHSSLANDYSGLYSVSFPCRFATRRSVVKNTEDVILLVYGVPQYLICNNGHQMRIKEFKQICARYGVQVCYNPRAIIIAGIKIFHALSCALSHESTGQTPLLILAQSIFFTVRYTLSFIPLLLMIWIARFVIGLSYFKKQASKLNLGFYLMKGKFHYELGKGLALVYCPENKTPYKLWVLPKLEIFNRILLLRHLSPGINFSIGKAYLKERTRQHAVIFTQQKYKNKFIINKSRTILSDQHHKHQKVAKSAFYIIHAWTSKSRIARKASKITHLYEHLDSSKFRIGLRPVRFSFAFSPKFPFHT